MKLVLIITITFSIFSTIPSYGQEKSAEDPNTNEESWYSRFTRKKIEERTLFKLGFKNFSKHGNKTYDITTEAAIEYKFTPHLSLNLKVKNVFGRTIKIPNGGGPFYEINTESYNYLKLSPEIRFYLGLNKGITKGKRANNFNGMFMALQFDDMLSPGGVLGLG